MTMSSTQNWAYLRSDGFEKLLGPNDFALMTRETFDRCSKRVIPEHWFVMIGDPPVEVIDHDRVLTLTALEDGSIHWFGVMDYFEDMMKTAADEDLRDEFATLYERAKTLHDKYLAEFFLNHGAEQIRKLQATE